MAISQLLTIDSLHRRNSSSVTYRTADPKPKFQVCTREIGVLAQKVRFGVENGIEQGSRADLPYAATFHFGGGCSLARGLTTFLTSVRVRLEVCAVAGVDPKLALFGARPLP